MSIMRIGGDTGINISMIPSATFLMGALTRFSGDVRSVREPLKRAVDEVVIPRIHENFRWEGEAERVKWKPLSEVTYEMPERRGARSPILNVSGNLERAATRKGIWNFEGQTGVAYVDDIPGADYGFVHQFGGMSYLTGGEIPARPFLVINDEDIEAIDEIFREWLSERIGMRLASGAVISSAVVNR